MLQEVYIESSKSFNFEEFCQFAGLDTLTLCSISHQLPGSWIFGQKGISNTLFYLESNQGEYCLSMDSLACMDDYKLFPYLVDSLYTYFTGKNFLIADKSAFRYFDEEWIETSIAEEIAYLKCVLKLDLKYYMQQPVSLYFPYLTLSYLNRYGVTLHSSTPRIYGYIQFILHENNMPEDKNFEEQQVNDEDDEEINVEVPQHISIGKVKSWQTDGQETWESYCEDDVSLLLSLAQKYENGTKVEGVVLNDIATIHEHGIGVQQDVPKAIHWYQEAIRQGDRLYAPTNLGEIYRRGCQQVPQNLEKSVEAFLQSEDPYAWYRLGQAYEEGWTEAPNMLKAQPWYHKALQAKHHLALKRFGNRD